MSTLDLRLDLPDGDPRQAATHAAHLLRDWLEASPAAEDVSEVRVRRSGEALVTANHGARRIQLRLQRDPTAADRWRLQADTWLVPTGYSAGWPVLAALLMTAIAVVASFRLLAYGAAAFALGVLVAIALGGLVGGMTWRRQNDRRAMAANREAGGQRPADELLDQLAQISRKDPRVLEVSPGPALSGPGAQEPAPT